MDQPPPRFPPPFSPKPKLAGKRPRLRAFPQPAFHDAGRDLKTMFKAMDRRKWLFLFLSFAITFSVILGFLIDSDFRKLGPGPQLIYVESWSANRTDAEIQAQQKRDQTVRHQIQEQRRQQYQRLEKQLGIE